jgi:ferrous iron transport protein B
MARIAFIMDRIFRKFGLSGKSFIPILIGTGCGVPGIMATRTIENDHDRRMTIITTTFIPCSAKLPIIALIAGALFPGSIWVAPSAYFVGMAAIIISGIMLKKSSLFAGDPAPFIMELPAYHIPGLKGILIHVWERAKAFIKKATTVILLATVGVWFLSSFGWNLHMVEIEDSILASVGRVIAPVFAPLGWDDWKPAVATVTGLIAKENVVGTFGILYGFSEVGDNGAEVWGNLHAAFTPLSAYSFLMFNLLCAPCFAAIGAVRSEMGSTKWTLFSAGYQTLFSYIAALIVYQIGLLVTGAGFGIGTAAAFILLAILLYRLFKKPGKVVRKSDLSVKVKEVA